MITTILFDLDGTLLPMDTELFTKKYFKELSIKLKEYFTLEEVTKSIWGSTKYMVSNIDINKTNEEAFFEDFYKRVDYEAEVIDPILKDFYEKDFNNIKSVANQNKYIIQSVSLLKQKGYKLVVATNPLFPEKAVLHRIEWAGLNVEDFIFVTSFEKMHYCKPQLKFYEEILDNIEENASSCLMVGNDIVEDMIASKIGIKTYLIEDYVINKDKEDISIDCRGNYKDFYEFVRELPSLKQD